MNRAERFNSKIEFLMANPWAVVLIVLVIAAVVGFIIWKNIQETNAAEAYRKSERNRPDSIWKD